MKMQHLILRSFFLVLVMGLTLSSCKKDSTATEAIVGTWAPGTSSFTAMVGNKTLTQYYVDVMGFTQQVAESYAAIFELVIEQSFVGTLKIKSDNTYTSDFGGTADSGTWSLNAGKTALTINSTANGPLTFSVVELTSSKLHLQSVVTTTEDLNSDGTPETITISVDVSFTK